MSSMPQSSLATFLRLAIGLACIAMTTPAVRAQAPPQRSEVRAEDGHPLTLWSKRPPGTARGSILLLHGRTWGALPNFDLQVPGAKVSLMDALVARGYAVHALDQRGHGGTPRDATGWLTPDRAVRDAAVALDWIAAQQPKGVRRPALLGYSRGSMTALLAAQRHPGKLSSVILYAFPHTMGAARAAVGREPKSPPRAANTEAAAGEDFITPGSVANGVKEAYVKAALESDPVRVDWRMEEQFSGLDPSAVQVPLLLIHGDRDPYAIKARLPELFAQLTVADRWWVVLSNADHVAHLERQPEFVRAVASFMERQ